ncbi:MarR family winged helix-turn-helix transcriptional regulator [Gallibacterium salpingitidis]|uniref:MarR family transcriptional regulator n=1 Tax=Gallibacterium salpingitidis TaxID=505341 RepID=A0A1A7NQ48_9PAST|nr:MarR family transcriptional regulator [Gallibacterium salpingitidis]OBW91758.1 MarR family transcriptional regulator [Gallibacterium salpingitidis]
MNYFDQLSELTAQFEQIYANWAKEYNLTLNELRFLYHIGRNQQTTPSEIGNKWALPKQTVTSLCKQLDKKGFLVFLPDEQDKRGKVIKLTPLGLSFTLPLIEQITEIEHQTSLEFGEENIQQIILLFSHLQNLFAKNLLEK